MGNLISLYDQFTNAKNKNTTAVKSLSDSSCTKSASLEPSLQPSIIFHSQQQISYVLSTYHLNLPGNKHFRIYKNDSKTTGRHIAICQLQRDHNIEVDSYNKRNKNTPGFICRKKEVVCEALHYCTYANKKNDSLITHFGTDSNSKILVLRDFRFHTCNICSNITKNGRKSHFSSNSLSSSALSFAITSKNIVTSPSSIGDHLTNSLTLPINNLTYNQKFRVNLKVKESIYGSSMQQFLSIIPFLEQLRVQDSGLRIFIKLFRNTPSDTCKFINKNTQYFKKFPSKITQYSLRFGAVSVIPSFAVQRMSICAQYDTLEKKVSTHDATFLTGLYRGVLCNTVTPFCDNEIILDAFSVDSDNESLNAWNFLFETKQYVLGHRRVDHVDIFDRFPGITYLQKKWFEHSSVYDCIYHIKDDIRAPKLGNANVSEIEEFDKVWTELDVTKFAMKLQVCNQNIRPTVSQYINKSIVHEHSNPSRWALSHIIADREGINSIQSNESLHGELTRASAKSVCYPAIIIFLLNQQLHKLKKLHESYKNNKNVLPPEKTLSHDSAYGCIADYNIVRPNPNNNLYAVVSQKFPKSPDNLQYHKICLRTKSCSLHCLQHKGCWCREFIVFATFCNISIGDMYPKKMTVDGGRRTLDGITSINNDSFFSDINALPLSNVIITPPHIRAPKGRRPTKRFSKHDKKLRYNKKRKIRVQKLLSEGAQLDEKYTEKTNTCRSHASYCCSICGSTDHNATKCKKPADGFGSIMSTKDQNKYLDEGFLIIEIGGSIGSTIIPQSSEEYDMMRSNSVFSTQSVKFENRRNINIPVVPPNVHGCNQQNNIQAMTHTLDDIDNDYSSLDDLHDVDDIPQVTQEETEGPSAVGNDYVPDDTEGNSRNEVDNIPDGEIVHLPDYVPDEELVHVPVIQETITDTNVLPDGNEDDREGKSTDGNDYVHDDMDGTSIDDNDYVPDGKLSRIPLSEESITDSNVLPDINEDEDDNITYEVHPHVEMLGSRLRECYCAAGMLCSFIRDFVPGQKGLINGPAYEHHEDVPADAESLYWQDNGGVVCHNCKNAVHKSCCVRILPYISGYGDFGMFCRICVQNPNDVKEALESFRRTEVYVSCTP